MSLFDTLIEKLTARVVAESTAGRDVEAMPPPPLEAPYVCSPTRWGDRDEPPEEPGEARTPARS